MSRDIGFTAAQLIGSLKMRPFCDAADVQDLTPEQQAAMHVFLHETMAAYYRMRIVVPEDRALAVLNKRFMKAAQDKVGG